MKKRLISLITALSLILCAVAPISVKAASPYESAVTLSNVAASDWMSAIRGETKLTEITIPGTHDSCARKFKNDAFVSSMAKCQALNIPQQLDAGIRFLDIRCEVDPSTYSVWTVHGSADCWDGDEYFFLDFVFQFIYDWLDAHPSETVLVSIKEDDGNAGAAVFTSAIYEYIHGYGQGKYFYGSDYNYHDYWYLGKSVPTLDQVRGKCVLMNRFDQVIATSGSTASEEESGQKIKWGDYSDTSYSTPVYANVTNTNTGCGTFHVQDHYKWNNESKKLATQEMLSLGHYRGEYYINFSSTVSDSTIPNPKNHADAINPSYATYTYNKTKPSGIFAMDFASEEYARYIILNNEAVSNIVQSTDGNISYTLNRLTGELTVTGTGAMNNYAFSSSNGVDGYGSTAPWGDQIKNSLFDGQYNTDIITKITVGEGITSIGNYAFYGFDHVSEISLPSTVTSIGEGAFTKCYGLTKFDIHNASVSSIGTYAFKDCTSLAEFDTSSSVTSIADNAFTNTPNITMYGPDNVYSKTYADSHSIPYVVSDMINCSINAKAGSTVKESVNPFAGKDLSKGVTISFSKLCNSDLGWNTSLINFSTGVNSDNRYFIIMANGTILFNDGNGGTGGWNGCYFDINSSSDVNTTSDSWVDIDITIDKDLSGKHMLHYYIDGNLAKEYVLSDICASGYPSGVSGSDGIFSFLSQSDIHLYYGASFSIYPTMAGTADAYLDKAEFLTYAKTADEISGSPSYTYLNTFTDSLGGTPVTGWVDSGNSVRLDTTDNDGRTGTAAFPYTQNGGQYSNYIATGTNPFAGADSSKGLSISFWQRINGNYYGDLESITFAKGDLDAKKYFCIGTDGYIRFNNGDGGNDPALSSAGIYFDWLQANSDITNKVWQYITVDIIDDYHINVYINGVLSRAITITGAANYQANGGLMDFLTSTDTSLYFGGYTAYWGTCTLSLDNVRCYQKVLRDSEVYSLYMSETDAYPAAFANNFDSMPALYSGACELAKSSHGRTGVLYIPEASCNSEISVYSEQTLLNDNQIVLSGKEVTAEYTGAKQVKEWLIVNSSGQLISSTQSASDSFTFTPEQSSYIICRLKNAAATDFTAFDNAYAQAEGINKFLYTEESYESLSDLIAIYEDYELTSPTQIEVDNATYDILSEISALVNATQIVCGTLLSGYDDSDTITLGLYIGGSDTPAYETRASGNDTEFRIKNIADGSYTLKVSKNNHMPYESQVTIAASAVVLDIHLLQKGDVNKNYVVDITDISLILNSCLGSDSLTPEERLIADIDDDGTVDAFDAAMIDRLIYAPGISDGDVDQNTEINSYDYAMLRNYIECREDILSTANLNADYAGLISAYGEGRIITPQYYAADLNKDKSADGLDLIYLELLMNSII